jgi:hypothetical protein
MRGLFARSQRLGPLRDGDSAVGLELNRWSVESAQFPPPPQSMFSFVCQGREPVLPDDRAHLARWMLWKWIGREEREDVSIVRKEAPFCA